MWSSITDMVDSTNNGRSYMLMLPSQSLLLDSILISDSISIDHSWSDLTWDKEDTLTLLEITFSSRPRTEDLLRTSSLIKRQELSTQCQINASHSISPAPAETGTCKLQIPTQDGSNSSGTLANTSSMSSKTKPLTSRAVKTSKVQMSSCILGTTVITRDGK